MALGTMDVVGECVGMPVAAMRKTALDTFEEDEICDTVKNLREICDALRAEGKKVGGCGPFSLSPSVFGWFDAVDAWHTHGWTWFSLRRLLGLTALALTHQFSAPRAS